MYLGGRGALGACCFDDFDFWSKDCALVRVSSTVCGDCDRLRSAKDLIASDEPANDHHGGNHAFDGYLHLCVTAFERYKDSR